MIYFCKMKNKLFSLFLLISAFTVAQNTGSVSGRVLDAQSQLPLEGATVLIVGTSTGVVTDAEGYFKIEEIPAQSYNIEVSYLGFETQTLYNYIIKSVGNIPLRFELEEVAENLEEVVLV